jgi:hypothetical protein
MTLLPISSLFAFACASYFAKSVKTKGKVVEMEAPRRCLVKRFSSYHINLLYDSLQVPSLLIKSSLQVPLTISVDSGLSSFSQHYYS